MGDNSNPKAAFWTAQRRGTNFFNNVDSLERFKAARAIGIDLVRLTPNKWLNGRPPRERGNFLLGPRDTYVSVIPGDVEALRRTLDDAEQAEVNSAIQGSSRPESWMFRAVQMPRRPMLPCVPGTGTRSGHSWRR